ncbi:hypothetical protein GL4_3206 [Methyloceanibacter caenitepidi]|uniref:Uncharacterized protein n=1 Tax=Methyloceanibacter caenitepidi TaxID=1384459 RepID=A0A0A8K7W8_9HYPH|nr:hypothetical protein GL4_3206 [Methyloceanibacter caenitepidi]
MPAYEIVGRPGDENRALTALPPRCAIVPPNEAALPGPAHRPDNVTDDPAPLP